MPQLRHADDGQAADDGPDCAALRYSTVDIPSGDRGIRATAEVMRDLVRQGQGHPVVRDHAERAVTGLPPGRRLQELRALYDYVGQRTEYRRDPLINEWIRTPWYLLACEIDRGRVPQVDCDDLTTLYLALATSIGFDGIVRVVSTLPSGEFNHVYAVVPLDGGAGVPVDLTRYRVDPRVPWPRESRSLELVV